MREGNLFSCRSTPGVRQRRSSSPTTRRTSPMPRLTDSQKFMRDQEAKLLDAVREQADRKKKAERERQGGASCRDRAAGSPGRHRSDAVARRQARVRGDCGTADGSARPIIPNYVNETGYTEDIPGRTSVGDAQNRSLLAVLDLKSGKTVWADGSFAPPVPATEKPAPPPAGTDEAARPGRKAEREMRWWMPDVSDDGRFAVAAARSADNKDRWLVAVDPNTGKTRVVDTLHDDAWVREAGGGIRRRRASDSCPTAAASGFCRSATAGCTSTPLDAPTPSASRAQLTHGQMGDRRASALSRDGKTVLPHHDRSASRRAPHLRDADRGRRAHQADVDDRRERPAKSRPTTARSA